MKKDVGISVIIPCYNAEEYIERCLDSILCNYYDNLEIILVNDESQDKTGDIIKNYINRNPSIDIKYIENANNLGAGASRNVGIESASKEYIVFVDSDDTVSEDFLSEINRIVLTNQSDCIVFGVAIKNSKKTRRMEMFIGGSFKAEERQDINDVVVYIKGCTAGKAYKTAIINNNNVRFAELNRNEDMVFTKVAISFCASVYYTDKVLYNYYNNPKSLMNNVDLLDAKNAYKGYEIVHKKMSGRKFDAELNSIYLIEVVYSTTMTCLKKNEDARGNYYRSIEQYNSDDKYYSGYQLKYRTMFAMFKGNLFGIIERLLRIC